MRVAPSAIVNAVRPYTSVPRAMPRRRPPECSASQTMVNRAARRASSSGPSGRREISLPAAPRSGVDIAAPGYKSVTTHLFQKGDQFINTDVVFGVKEALIVDFVQKPAGSKAPTGEVMNEPFYEVKYDFRLAKAAAAQKAA